MSDVHPAGRVAAAELTSSGMVSVPFSGNKVASSALAKSCVGPDVGAAPGEWIECSRVACVAVWTTGVERAGTPALLRFGVASPAAEGTIPVDLEAFASMNDVDVFGAVVAMVVDDFPSSLDEGKGGFSRVALGFVVEKEGGSLNFLGARL
jgi:hypothetical protein